MIACSRAAAGVSWMGGCALLLLTGCGWPARDGRPDWLTGASRTFPSELYVTGLGEGDSVSSATEKAYASVAKVFRAEVTSEAREWESYLLVENRGKSRDERRLTLDHVTNVTTDKVLENVSVLAMWYDEPRRLFVVLAGLPRAQAETATVARLTELDHDIGAQVTEARQSTDVLTRLRQLKRATKALVLREAYNSDLRVIRANGQGITAPYRVADLSAELKQLVASVPIGLKLTGDHPDAIGRALSEGLLREGLSVVGEPSGGQPADGATPALLLKGVVQIRPIEVQDPQFRYVRWCSDVILVEPATDRVVGAFSRGDKIGHISTQEAAAKALRAIQQEFASDVAKNVAAYVYGDLEAATIPETGACPRNEGGGPPPQ